MRRMFARAYFEKIRLCNQRAPCGDFWQSLSCHLAASAGRVRRAADFVRRLGKKNDGNFQTLQVDVLMVAKPKW